MFLGKAFIKPSRPLIRAAYHALYRNVLPIHWWLVDRISPEAAPAPGFPLPPAKLRFRVSESTNAEAFFRIGKQASENMRTVLSQVGRSLGSFTNILDFGCGCGRTLMWLLKSFPEVHWHGTDVDSEAIDWCRKNIPNASFGVNAPFPPLAFPDGAFDFVYGISVFTHLSEEHQRAWIPELHRILKPGGLLLLTFHSEHVWKALDIAEEVERQGILFRTSTKLKGIVPDWYQTTFQTSSHILKFYQHISPLLIFSEVNSETMMPSSPDEKDTLTAYLHYTKVNFTRMIRAHVLHQLGELSDEQLAQVINPTKTPVGGNDSKAQRTLRMAQMLFKAGKRNKALETALRSIEEDPKLAEAHAMVGKVHAAMGDCTKALAAFDEALQLDPAEPTAGEGKKICQH